LLSSSNLPSTINALIIPLTESTVGRGPVLIILSKTALRMHVSKHSKSFYQYLMLASALSPRFLLSAQIFDWTVQVPCMYLQLLRPSMDDRIGYYYHACMTLALWLVA
jgi:hypothetical protein